MNPKKPRALVVEDCRTVAAIVKHFLQRDGFEVLVATDGIAGLDTVKRERPRIVITDVNMPGMDGLDMVKAIRADSQTQGTVVFVLSSDERPECEQQALAAGADAYLLKPIKPEDLAARARAAMDGTVSTS
jgi:two-component system response regulator AdeR